MGAVIDAKHMQRVLGFIEESVAAGLAGARGHRALPDGRLLRRATVLDGVRRICGWRAGDL
jgi:acyl-CoA reductase-like NAD-dependent aldehyde dehydrogenase